MGNYPVSVHDSYLINLASPKPDSADKSVKAFAEELRRTEKLGIEYLVTHPGSHLGSGKLEALERYVANLDQAIALSETEEVKVLIENTAGQGTNLGSRFGELATILEDSGYTSRMGVCFDTCHAFAAGYDLRSAESCAEVFERFDKLIGIDFIRFFISMTVNRSLVPIRIAMNISGRAVSDLMDSGISSMTNGLQPYLRLLKLRKKMILTLS